MKSLKCNYEIDHKALARIDEAIRLIKAGDLHSPLTTSNANKPKTTQTRPINTTGVNASNYKNTLKLTEHLHHQMFNKQY